MKRYVIRIFHFPKNVQLPFLPRFQSSLLHKTNLISHMTEILSLVKHLSGHSKTDYALYEESRRSEKQTIEVTPFFAISTQAESFV